MCVPSTIDAEFVEFNAIHGTIGDTLIRDFTPIQIEGDSIIVKGGDEVLPYGGIDGPKTVRIVVIQFPVTRISSTCLELEGVIISGNIVDGNCRSMPWLPTVIGLNPEANREVRHHVFDIDSGLIINPIEECTVTEDTGSPLAPIGSSEIQMSCTH